jgi:tRNA pseudouridine55 synthase
MAHPRRPAGPDGLLVLDKPGGLTSRAALDRALRWFPRGTRAGHTGTLDPLATGVLVFCLGAATRLAEYVQAMPKTYRAGLRLGARSDTDDADGTVTPADGAAPPVRAALEAALAGFVGYVEQVPPAFSAALVEGRRAYDLARRGQDVALAARRVDIHGIDVLAFDYPRLELEVRCGKGTYVRALARDLGERLGCGAYVETLRRTRVGPFSVDDALTLDVDPEAARARVLPVEMAVAELSRVELPPPDAERLARGQAVPLPGAAAGEVAVFDAAGRLVAVGRADPAGGVLRPAKVLAQSK